MHLSSSRPFLNNPNTLNRQRQMNRLLLLAFCITACLVVPPVSAAIPLELGSNFVGHIEGPGAVHQFTFQANRSDIVYISVGSVETLKGSPEIVLYSPSMTELARDYGVAPTEISYTLPVSGTYTVTVNDYFHTNSFYYCLYLQCVNHPINAPVIGSGTWRPKIGPRGELNDFLMDGRVGGQVLIRVSQTSMSVVPEITIFAPNGTRVLRKTGMPNVETTFPFPVTGRYTILIGDRDRSDDMTYTLYVMLMNGPPDPPVANFSAQPRQGAAPCHVNFSDLSTNEPTDWEWDFGDGSTSIDQNPVHNYSSAGIYNVTLTAINEGGSNTTVNADFIRVFAPIAALGGSGLPPTDLDDDGLYEDCNGNGRLDFADVVLFFNNFDWINQHCPVAAFDFNHNQRIDFADVVSLFGRL